MTLAYFDCFAGAAGDMIVASLLDAGADLQALREGLAALQVPGYWLEAQPAMRSGLAGTKFDVRVDDHHDHPHRHLGDILQIIEAAGLPARAAQRARRVFERLGEVEAAVHRIAVDEVHFHEVGAVDSIVDIVATCLALEQLDVDRVICSPIPPGSGTVRCDHGVLPVPAPATARLLVGVPTRNCEATGELTTPTAAAMLTTLAESFGPLPAMTVSAVGYGAGTRNEGPVPNLLRVVLGQASDAGEADSLVELAANLDDCTGEVVGATIEKLLAAGCVDAWAAPIVMKKSRPAWVLSALCAACDVEAMEAVLFGQTTTFGVRRRPCARTKLLRHHETVETAYGPVRVKVGLRGGRVVTASPEFADCLAAADTHHVALREVYAAAQAAFGARQEP